MPLRKIQQAKIYKITCNITRKVYYGSTCKKNLKNRLNKHEKDFCEFFERTSRGYCSSFEIICEGDYKIELVENVKCENKKQLYEKEKFYITNNQCVNVRIPNTDRRIKAQSKYLCEVCNKELSWQHKKRHEQRKIHQRNLKKI